MKLIDRYVAEVGRNLPLVRGRKDIEKELRSTLEDMLEDRARKSGQPVDETLEIDLLKEYGAPQTIAQTYNPQPYLIGPRMFPFFVFVLKIVITVVTIVLLVLTGIEIATLSPMAGPDFVKAVWDGLTGVVGAAIAAFGNIVLVFAILERFVPASEFQMDEEKEWDPASLKKEPEPDEVKIWEPILAIVFTFIAISIFNFNPQWLVIPIIADDKAAFIPALTEAFFRWLPWINIGWVAEIVMNGMLIRTGRWTISTRLVSIGIKVFQVVILYFLFTGPSILAVTPESLQASGVFDADAAQTLGDLAQNGVRILIGLGIFGTVIEIIKTLYKLVTQRSSISV
ncbi:MAG: hypothetical protein Q8L87_07615 [Anaerolineales bacterium]|nr:hypothetical protein [Anaerolineales bacterium]